MPIRRQQKVRRQRSSGSSTNNNLALACVLAFVLMLSSVTVAPLPTKAVAQQAPPPSPPAGDGTTSTADNTISKALTKEEGDHDKKFEIVEATIPGIHEAIKAGDITCTELVQQYIDRAKAYNGVCTQLVTEDGAPIPPATGYVRAGSPIAFPTSAIPITSMFPNFDQYIGLPIDLGRMEATASDPSVQHQIGMTAGIPNAGQLNALETLNIRGERSVTCKGAFDAHPSTGPLPEGAPEQCEEFRQQPDALERAAELDAQYGSNPPLDELPMYCIAFSIKDWYDVKDMRSTGGNDVNYAMDAAPEDSTITAQLRAKGAIILGVSVASEITNSATGPASATKAYFPDLDNARSTWGGATCNPYDTERQPGFSSGGAGASVSANLVTCAICETTGGSCRNPAANNGVASLVTTKGLTSEDGTATAQFINHRPGVLCRTLGDAALVLDAIKDPVLGYFDPEDMFTGQPRAFVSDEPYANLIVDDKDVKQKPLDGMRIGVVREFMIKPTLNDVAITDQIDNEIKTILRGTLGAELVETIDPLYPDDPEIANMEYTFQDAFSEIIAFNAPEYFSQRTSSGELEFAVPGWNVTTRDYMVALALGEAPLSDNLNLRRSTSGLDNTQRTPFSMAKYLSERGDTRITDWADYAANSKWFADSRRAGAENAATLNVQDIRATQGIDRIKMQTVFRLAVLNVMYENDIDAFVIPAYRVPPEKIGFAREPPVQGFSSSGTAITDLLGVPEIIVPAGYNQIVYEPQYELSANKTSYIRITGTEQTLLPNPMPISILFFAGPGDEPTALKVGSAYEAATHHRISPPDFGPLSDDESFPITHMSNTTASAGYGVYAQKPARAEYVTNSSELVGDNIDSITLRMKSVGTINGTAEIGILNEDLSVKKLFGTLDVDTLTPTYTDYEFKLTDELYTIESGDRIGIKYEGGGFNETSWVSVMLDLDAEDPFDGANSYLQYHYQGSWRQSPDRDMHMTLQQTHG
jgi:amidase